MVLLIASRNRMADESSPMEATARLTIDYLHHLAVHIDDELPHDTPAFRRRVRSHCIKTIEQLAHKHNLDVTLPPEG